MTHEIGALTADAAIAAASRVIGIARAETDMIVASDAVVHLTATIGHAETILAVATTTMKTVTASVAAMTDSLIDIYVCYFLI